MSDSDPIIKVYGLFKKFNDFLAVDNIAFVVNRGEIFAFLGPNGAGKTTTIKILTTLLTPTSGEITVNGYNPVNDQDHVRKSFGIVFQDPSLDDELTAYENLEIHAALYSIPREEMKQRTQTLMEMVELWDRRDNMVKTFSGGMKRRLEIARGLLHHPQILFLDEPTLGLDPQTRNRMWEYVKKINNDENMTVFFTTHYMEEADRVADRIAVIDHGKIIATGNSGDLKKQTNTTSLEDAFLALTGKTIREETVTGADHMRAMRRMWRHR